MPSVRVALLMLVVGDLGGSGGAERYFADLFEFLRRQGSPEIYLVTATASLRRLRTAGRLAAADHVIALPLGASPAAGRLGVLWATFALLWVAVRYRFDVVHICLPTPTYVPFAAVTTLLPGWLRPRVTLNVIDCTVAPNLLSRHPEDLYEQQVLDAHHLYARWTRIDGVLSWYQAFVDAARARRWFTRARLVRPTRFCFADTARFKAAALKEQLVVFAGRLSAQKRPLLFVEAVAALRQRCPDVIAGWRFEMYGGGPLEPAVRESIRRHGLDELVVLRQTPDLSPVFARSRLFVSTQAIENFTSLAMLEAMAAGNIVVAEDVGQTREFVRDGENGYLVANASPDAFADAIAKAIRESDAHERMAAASRRLATEVHTIRNFAEDITTFWRDVLKAA